MDDGVEQTRTFRIAGVHESGRLLPEIEVTVKEFGKMDWVLERWGAECIIEPGNSSKENIGCAILKTVGDAEKKTVYRTTGWKQIDGKWEYLLPNDGNHDVRLFGKLRHYEMANHWSDSDLKTVWSMMKDRLIATNFPSGILRAEICSVSDWQNRLTQKYAGGVVPIVLRKVQRYGFAVVIQ